MKSTLYEEFDEGSTTNGVGGIDSADNNNTYVFIVWARSCSGKRERQTAALVNFAQHKRLRPPTDTQCLLAGFVIMGVH